MDLRADFNLDRIINILDIGYLGNSFGKTSPVWGSGFSVSVSPTTAIYDLTTPAPMNFTAKVAGGTAPYRYQWYSNSTGTVQPVNGATLSNYSFAPPGDGVYQVYVVVGDSSLPVQAAQSRTAIVEPSSRFGGRISVYPSSLAIPLGSTTTIAVTANNISSLSAWQVLIGYNGSVINCSAVWVPESNVFQGEKYFSSPGPINPPTMGGLDCVLASAVLLGHNSVNVSNGILFDINFTAVGSGNSPILIATEQNPGTLANPTPTDLYSFLLDADLKAIPFIGVDGLASVISSGNGTVSPGVGVTVFPTDDVGLTFANVTAAGYVTVNKTSTVLAPPLNNTVGPYMEFTITANYSGNVTVSVAYGSWNMTPQQESSPQLIMTAQQPQQASEVNLTLWSYSRLIGDIRATYGQIDFNDIGYIAKHIWTSNETVVPWASWDPDCDISSKQCLVKDGKVDMCDLAFVAKNFLGNATWIPITLGVYVVDNQTWIVGSAPQGFSDLAITLPP